MKPKLIVVGGEVKSKELMLSLPTVIGRGRNVTLTLPHPLVSRRHCEIFAKGDQLIVRDLGSLNGTFINNQRIEGEHPLANGELLTIGSVTFRAAYDSELESTPDNISDTDAAVSFPTLQAEEYQDRHLLIDKKTKGADESAEQDSSVAAQLDLPEKPRANPVPFADAEVELDINKTLSYLPESESVSKQS